ncbi:hypothetical protein A2382_03700 [Candidatus Woesebacteria bacterium RIFOXYB1_FULL_38_16]|uniref:EamA domain-containing protein n=1 Tax=Candidatus Woesebacteria bacterium RIFOXYB1_FULL_38_16 TaxID=1802538 RepID=A0A1F8CR16_9BACT|nr:MAG: hypothetical protein A2382_03700 [Candidatus Woesebacteria bacterium RIFOXYB1_FULL_38_16]
MKEQNYMRGFWALLICAVLYSISGVAVKVLNETFGSYGQVVVRSALILLVAGVYLAYSKNGFAMPGLNRILLLFLGVIIVTQFLGNLFFAESMMRIKATNGIFYLYAAQLLAGIFLGPTINHEKATSTHFIAWGLTLVGIMVFSYPFKDFQDPLMKTGILLAMGTGAIEAVKYAAMKKFNGFDRFKIIFYTYLGATIIMTSVLIFAGQPFSTGEFQAITLLALVVMVVIGTVLHWLLLYGNQNFEVNLASIVIASEIMFAAVVNFILLGEIPSLKEVIGMVILFSSLVLVKLANSNKPVSFSVHPAKQG